MAEMHYTSIPRDISNDSVSASRNSNYKSLDYANELFVNDSNSINGSLLIKEDDNSENKLYKELKDCREKCKAYRKYSELIPSVVQNSYDPLSNSVTCKSNSLPGRSNNASPVPQATVATNIQAEDLASQLTLLDVAVFKSIQPAELSSCSWNKKNKLVIAPHVVSFTRRFNHVSYWTVQEILNGPTPKQRSETLSHFIRVAKKLYDLNNLHSLFAVICGLQSASIYRLNKTWACISKKDRGTFDRLAEIFGDVNNWMNLREHMDAIKLPCIPYLGLFLTDLVYIDMAHPVSKNGDNTQRTLKMNAVLTRVSVFQDSDYSHILPLSEVQRYLNNVRYIEELQKFLEDDHFKLSMKLEPNSPVPSSSSSKESVGDIVTGVAALSLSPARGCAGSLRLHATSAATKFVPGHRKCRSLGTNIFGKPNIIPLDPNKGTVRHLLDDSVLEEPHLTNQIIELDQNSPSSPIDTVNDNCSLLSKNSEITILPCEIDGSIEPRCSMQGSLRRKVILRDGRKPTVSIWQRYWVQLWASSLVYFSPKCFKGNDRSDFKREPYKMISILGWIAEPFDTAFHPDTFLLTDPKKGNVYKFKANTNGLADQWIKELRMIVRGKASDRRTLPANLMSFE